MHKHFFALNFLSPLIRILTLRDVVMYYFSSNFTWMKWKICCAFQRYFSTFNFRLWYVMFFLTIGILSVLTFVLLGFFYAYFTSGYYWDIYGYVVIAHLSVAPFWSFELSLWIVIHATMNKFSKRVQNPDRHKIEADDVSSTELFSTKLWILKIGKVKYIPMDQIMLS